MTKSNPTFSEKMQQLEELLAWFESDEVTLEQAVEKYKTALKLSSELQAELSEAQNKIEVIDKKFS